MSYQYGQQQQSGDLDALDAQRKAAWYAYSSLQCAPGWLAESKELAAAAARAQYAYDKASRGQ